jgi:hypothetical protein
MFCLITDLAHPVLISERMSGDLSIKKGIEIYNGLYFFVIY